jgi:hypothetical protein
MDSKPKVGGTIRATGSVRFQSSARVSGDINAGTTFTSTDGRTIAYLKSNGMVGGEITAGTGVAAPPATALPSLGYDAGAWPGFTATTWRQWMNATATANKAPSWSQGLTSTPGCVMAPWGSSVNGNTVSITHDTLVDARRSQSNCASVSLQGMTVRMRADLVLFADSIQAVNGLKAESADGKTHTLRLLVPGTTPNCKSGQNVTLSGGIVIDPRVTTQVFTPGKVLMNGPISLTGQVISGCLGTSGVVSMNATTVDTPGLRAP